MSFENIVLLTLSEQIANHIKQRIIDGELKPGEKLPPEKELIEYFNVSRPTLREAIKSLTAINILESKQGANGGHFVSQISYEAITNNFGDFILLSLGLKGISLEEVAEMRQLIEIHSAYESAQRRTEDDLIKFEKIIEDMKNSTPSSFYNLDFDFHRQLAFSTHNRLIIITTEAIIMALKPLYRMANCSNELKEELTKEIIGIYEAIKDKKPDIAKRKMEKHINHFEIDFGHQIKAFI